MTPTQVVPDGEALARRFHEAYERLAPSFGYETRQETRAFDPESANGKLMIAVCSELLAAPAAAGVPEQIPVPRDVAEVIARDLPRYMESGVTPEQGAGLPGPAATIYVSKTPGANGEHQWTVVFHHDLAFADNETNHYTADQMRAYAALARQQSRVVDARALAAFKRVVEQYEKYGPVGHPAGRFIRQYGRELLAALEQGATR